MVAATLGLDSGMFPLLAAMLAPWTAASPSEPCCSSRASRVHLPPLCAGSGSSSEEEEEGEEEALGALTVEDLAGLSLEQR